MSRGISFQESDRDQVEDMWRQIRDLEQQMLPGWQRRSTQSSRERGGVRELINYANGCQVELARHNLPDGGYRDTVMRITLPARDESREVPPSPANEANRSLLVGGRSSNMLLAGAPVMVSDRAQMDALFGRQSGEQGRRLLQPAARRGEQEAHLAAVNRANGPRLQRHPNDVELAAFQSFLSLLMSNPGMLLAEREDLGPWQVIRDPNIQGGEGGVAAGSMMFAFLSRVSRAGEASARQSAEAAATRAPQSIQPMRRRLLDT